MSLTNQIYTEEWVNAHKEIVVDLLNVFSFRFFPLTHGGRIDRPPGSRILDILAGIGSPRILHFVGNSVDSTGASCELYVSGNYALGDFMINSHDELHVRPGRLYAAQWFSWDGTVHNVVLKSGLEAIVPPSEIEIRRSHTPDREELENPLDHVGRADPFIRGEDTDIKVKEEPVDLSAQCEQAADLPVLPELETPMFDCEGEQNNVGPSPCENVETYNFDSLNDADLDHWASEIEGLMDILGENKSVEME